MRLMIVDDEALIGLDVAQILSEKGYEIVGPFTTSGDAIKAIDSGAVDGAILDINLGGTYSSNEIAGRLKGDDIPFFFLTGYSQTSSKIASEFPGIHLLAKPCDPTTLVATVESLIGTPRS